MSVEQSLENHTKSKSHPEIPINLSAAYEKALRENKKRIDPRSYIRRDGSNRENVINDLKQVQNMKKIFAEKLAKKTEREKIEDDEARMLGISLEAAFLHRVNEDGWFGEDATAILCTEFDDIENSVDIIVALHGDKREQKTVFLGIDITYSYDPSKKFKDIKAQIGKSRLGTVKYFRDEEGTFPEDKPILPTAVVVLSDVDAARIVRDWDMNVPAAKNYGKVILRQIEMQLEVYRNYALRLEQGARRYNLSHFLEEARRNISEMLYDISKQGEPLELENESSIKLVKDNLEKVFMLAQTRFHTA